MKKLLRLNFSNAKKTRSRIFFLKLWKNAILTTFKGFDQWGKIGDMKNDGYLRSQRKLFQVYAPNELSASKTTSKIDDDFNGALPFWEKYFDSWVFVHNSRSGLGPEVLMKLLELKKANPRIEIEHWGFEELRQKTFSLNDNDLVSLLGYAPSNKDMMSIGFEDLKVVLEIIARQQPIEELDLRPVSHEKLYANGLSDNVEILLKAGMRKAIESSNFSLNVIILFLVMRLHLHLKTNTKNLNKMKTRPILYLPDFRSLLEEPNVELLNMRHQCLPS